MRQLLLFSSSAKDDNYVQFVGKGMSELIDAKRKPLYL
jgi:hypothetical protein